MGIEPTFEKFYLTGVARGAGGIAQKSAVQPFPILNPEASSLLSISTCPPDAVVRGCKKRFLTFDISDFRDF